MVDQVIKIPINKAALKLPEELLRELGWSPESSLLVSSSSDGLFLRNALPPLGRLYIEPTNVCNLKCSTCIRNTWKECEGFMDTAMYRKIINDVRNIPSLKKISFWGFGEPLLHPDIIEMIALAKELGVETQLITNALLLTRTISEGLIKAGLDSIVVSIDGTTEKKQAEIRSGAALHTVKQNVKQLYRMKSQWGELWKDNKPEIGIEFVVMRSNIDELDNLRELAVELGANFIFITNLLPYTEELKDEILYWNSIGMRSSQPESSLKLRSILPPIDNHPEIAEHIAKVAAINHPVTRPQFAVNILNSGKGYCPFVGQGSLAIRWDGEASPCVPLMHSYSCYVLGRKKEIKCYAAGNVESQHIAELWSQSDFKNFRERVQCFDFSPCIFCGSCERTDSNDEDCFLNPFPVCGDCLWAQGVIQCP